MERRQIRRLVAVLALVAAGCAAIFVAVASAGAVWDAASSGDPLSSIHVTHRVPRRRRLADTDAEPLPGDGGEGGDGGKGADGGKGGKGGKGTAPVWQPRLGPFWGEPVIGCFFGVISLVLSTAILWAQSSYMTRVYGLYTAGEKELVSLHGKEDFGDDENNFKLVHVNKAMMQPQAALQDRVFGVKMTGVAVRMRRTVEIFQYVPNPNEAAKTFSLKWYGGWHHPGDYPKDSVMRKNRKPEGLTIGPLCFDSSEVHLGDGWTMPETMLGDFEAFVPASRKVEDSILTCSCAEGNLTFEQDGDWWYYSPRGNPDSSNAKLGDVRVTWEIVPAMEVTVMALQVPRKLVDPKRVKVSSPQHTFLPYRLPRALWLCDNEVRRHQSLFEEAVKPKHQRIEDIACVEPFGALCCACRGLNQRVIEHQLHQIYYLSPVASETAQDSFANLEQELPRRPTWVLVPLCWILQCLGCVLMVNQFYGSLSTWTLTSLLMDMLPEDLVGRIGTAGVLFGTAFTAGTIGVANGRVSKRKTLAVLLIFLGLGCLIVVGADIIVPRFIAPLYAPEESTTQPPEQEPSTTMEQLWYANDDHFLY